MLVDSLTSTDCQLGQILKQDNDAREKAPRVIQEDLSKSKSKKGARSYSTMVTAADAETELDAGGETLGLKFAMPGLPLPSNAHIKHRYDPVVQQVTTLLMRDGKIGAARTVRSSILQLSWTSFKMQSPWSSGIIVCLD